MTELMLLRHAKSDWTDRETDFERGLNERGRVSCNIMAERLAFHHFNPDLILCSTARRCQLTASYLSEADMLVDWPEKTKYLDSLYLADHRTIAQLIEEQAQEAALAGHPIKRICVIAHNPGLSDLGWALLGERTAIAADIAAQMPTAAYLWMQLADLTHLAPASAEVKAYEWPRQFYDFEA